MTEMEQMIQNELLLDVASSIEQYGAKRFAEEFKQYFPDHFKELLIQMERKEKQIPALLKPNANSV